MTNRTIIIGSRGSDLALWQARFFRDRMKAIGVEADIRIIKTKGDRIQHLSFDKMEGKGFFTKEIEQALHNGEIDVAIHSHKDLETTPSPGLTIAAVSDREDPSELLLVRPPAMDHSQQLPLRQGAVVGTSSARRKGQLTDLRPDVKIKDIRGNVPTRIAKLRSGDFDAILIAFAGVHRLGIDLEGLHVEKLDPAFFIPAPAQGVLAYQCREEDEPLIRLIGKINDPETKVRIDIERSVLSTYGGGCQVPLGAYAVREGGGFTVRVAHSRDWRSFSNRHTFHVRDAAEARAVFSRLKTSQIRGPVLITKTLDEGSFLRAAARAHGLTLYEEPFIRVVPADFDLPDFSTVEWIFFSSRNAVKHFLAKAALPPHLRIGAMGEGTARELRQLGCKVDFSGDSSDPESVARNFAARAGESRVLFPQSDISNRTVQQTLGEKQAVDLTVYETRANPQRLPQDFASIVFTSPSNAAAYFQAGNSPGEHTNIVAIGPKTAEALAKRNLPVRVASIPSEPEIYSLLSP